MTDDTATPDVPPAANYALGRGPVRHDDRTLRLATYLATPAKLPTPPTSTHYADAVTFRMFDNDTLGCCTIAAIANVDRAWRHDAGHAPRRTTDKQVANTYLQMTGGQDTGLVELDVLNHWRHTGILGVQLGAYAAVDLTADALRTAVYLFQGIYTGINLPTSAQAQVGGLWTITGNPDDPDNTPGSWGGHAVPVIDYNQVGPVVATWGARQQCTWAWWAQYCDEQYALISPDLLDADGRTVAGFDAQHLAIDLAAL